jgi:hypothetical protein
MNDLRESVDTQNWKEPSQAKQVSQIESLGWFDLGTL